MGAYSEYLDRQMDFRALTAERKAQLERIARLRGGRDVLVYAADLTKVGAPISMTYADILPIQGQLANLGGEALDLVLETPGGAQLKRRPWPRWLQRSGSGMRRPRVRLL